MQIVDKTISLSKGCLQWPGLLKYAIRVAFNLSPNSLENCHSCSHPLALAMQQNLKKSQHLCEQKVACVAAALECTPGWVFFSPHSLDPSLLIYFQGRLFVGVYFNNAH